MKAGLEERRRWHGTATIGEERSSSVVPRQSGVHRVSDSRTTGQEKGGGYQSNASGAGLFEASSGKD